MLRNKIAEQHQGPDLSPVLQALALKSILHSDTWLMFSKGHIHHVTTIYLLNKSYASLFGILGYLHSDIFLLYQLLQIYKPAELFTLFLMFLVFLILHLCLCYFLYPNLRLIPEVYKVQASESWKAEFQFGLWHWLWAKGFASLCLSFLVYK